MSNIYIVGIILLTWFAGSAFEFGRRINTDYKAGSLRNNPDCIIAAAVFWPIVLACMPVVLLYKFGEWVGNKW